MNDHGRFLVSTKCGVARYLILFLCSGFFIGMAIWFMMNSEKIIRSFTRDFDNKTIGVIIPLALIGFLLAYPIILILAYRSHCLVYENAVVGITTMSNNEKSLQKFVLSYDQIVNVTLSKSVIQIYTPYSTFQVLGGSNRAEAIHEIRSRMRGIAGAIPTPVSIPTAYVPVVPPVYPTNTMTPPPYPMHNVIPTSTSAPTTGVADSASASPLRISRPTSMPTPQVTEPAPTSVPPVAKPAPLATTSDDTSKDSESFSFFSKP